MALKPALRDISVTIPVGKTTVLVGPSGAGKSTLIKLLLRFYDAKEGEIYVDGHRCARGDIFLTTGSFDRKCESVTAR
jgi:ABC-type multidrug transport system fused ATPase/permease subunit